MNDLAQWNDIGPLRIQLKLLLKFLRNRCVRKFTPKQLQLQPFDKLSSQQSEKPCMPHQFFILDKKDVH